MQSASALSSLLLFGLRADRGQTLVSLMFWNRSARGLDRTQVATKFSAKGHIAAQLKVLNFSGLSASACQHTLPIQG